MDDIDGFAIHERTTANDALHSASLALANRFFRDAAVAERAMEPDAVDAALPALPHDFDRDIRVGGDDDPIDRARDRADIGKAPHAFHLGRPWIDGDRLVPGVAELPEYEIGRTSAGSRDARYRDPLSLEELSDRLGNIGHRLLLPSACPDVRSLLLGVVPAGPSDEQPMAMTHLPRPERDVKKRMIPGSVPY
jgi:hypothetical protein